MGGKAEEQEHSETGQTLHQQEQGIVCPEANAFAPLVCRDDERDYKKYAKTTLIIITDRDQEIYQIIKNKTNHDATVFQGKGCYAGTEHKMLYTVVSSQESGALEKAIRNVDPSAFINVIQSKEIIGRFYKRAND